MLLPLYQVSCREAQTSSDSYLSHWGLTDSLLQCLRNTNFRNKPPFCTVETCDLAFKLLTLLIFLLTHLNPSSHGSQHDQIQPQSLCPWWVSPASWPQLPNPCSIQLSPSPQPPAAASTFSTPSILPHLTSALPILSKKYFHFWTIVF